MGRINLIDRDLTSDITTFTGTAVQNGWSLISGTWADLKAGITPSILNSSRGAKSTTNFTQVNSPNKIEVEFRTQMTADQLIPPGGSGLVRQETRIDGIGGTTGSNSVQFGANVRPSDLESGASFYEFAFDVTLYFGTNPVKAVFNHRAGETTYPPGLASGDWVTWKVHFIREDYAKVWYKKDGETTWTVLENTMEDHIVWGEIVKWNDNIVGASFPFNLTEFNFFGFLNTVNGDIKISDVAAYDLSRAVVLGLTNEDGDQILGVVATDDGSGSSTGGEGGYGGGGKRTVTLTFQAGGYVNAVAGDIEKGVTGASGDTGVLKSVDNGTRIWLVDPTDAGDLFDSSQLVSVDSGTGQGTTTGAATIITIQGGIITGGTGLPGEASEGNVDLSPFVGTVGFGDNAGWHGTGSGINLTGWSYTRETDGFGFADLNITLLDGWSELLQAWEGLKFNVIEDGIIVFRGYVTSVDTPDKYSAIVRLHVRHHKLNVLETEKDYSNTLSTLQTQYSKVTSIATVSIQLQNARTTDILTDGTHGILIIPGAEPASSNENFAVLDTGVGTATDVNTDDSAFVNGLTPGVIEISGTYSGTRSEIKAIKVTVKSSVALLFQGNTLRYSMFNKTTAAYVEFETEVIAGSYLPIGAAEFTTEFEITTDPEEYVDSGDNGFQLKLEPDNFALTKIFFADVTVFTDSVYNNAFFDIISKTSNSLTSSIDMEAAGVNIGDTVVVGTRNDIVIQELVNEFFFDMTVDVDAGFTGYTASNFKENFTISAVAIQSVLKKELGFMYYRPDIDTLFFKKKDNLVDQGLTLSNSVFHGGDFQVKFKNVQRKQQDKFRSVIVTGNNYKQFDDTTKPVSASALSTGLKTDRVLRITETAYNSQTECQQRADKEKLLLAESNLVFDIIFQDPDGLADLTQFYPGTLMDIRYHGVLETGVLLKMINGSYHGGVRTLNLHFGWKGTTEEDQAIDRANEMRTAVRLLQSGMGTRSTGDLVGLIAKHWHEISAAPDFDTVVWNWLTLLDPGSPPSHVPGQMFFDGKVLNVPSTDGANMQVGLETWDFGHNSSGVTIADGSVVYPMGIVAGLGNARLAKADSLTTAVHPLAVATVDILDGQNGQVTVFGDVNGIDTSGLSLGPIFLSATVAGGMTSTPPVHPNIRYLIGFCKVVDAVDGVIFVFQDYRDNQNFLNGTMRETMRVLVTEAAGVITASLDRGNGGGGGDLTMQFSDGFTILDSTPAIDIVLTAGPSATALQMNYLFVPQSTKVLTLSTSDFPHDVEHIKVARIGLFNAAKTNSDGGAKILQVHNDHQANSTGQGHNAHQGERMRIEEAKCTDDLDGAATTPAGAYLEISASNVHWKSEVGVVYQLHRQVYPAKDQSVSDTVTIANDETTPFLESSNLFTDITTDSIGGALQNNKYFNLFCWGVQNKTGELCPIMVNKPGGQYTNLNRALTDADGFDNLSIPREFNRDSTTGFPICRITIQMGTTWTIMNTDDLRGSTPTAVSGGVGIFSGITDHPSLTDKNTEADIQHATAAQVAAWHPEVTALAHAAITSPNSEADVQHLTAAQVAALHATYTNAEAVSAIEAEADVVLTGTIKVADNKNIIIGDGDDATLHHDGTDTWLSVISSTGTRNLYFDLADSGHIFARVRGAFRVIDRDNADAVLFSVNANVDTIEMNAPVTLSSGTDVNEFSIDDTLAGDSDDAVPTEKAVKTYVDGQTHTDINWNATTVSQAEAEAGTAETDRKWTALRVAQAIDAQAPVGGGDILADGSVPFTAIEPIGAGKTASAWSGFLGFEGFASGLVFATATEDTWWSSNAYWDGANWRYIVTAEAVTFGSFNGSILVRVAASGTAGNVITWITSFTVANDGKFSLTSGTSVNDIDIVMAGSPTDDQLLTAKAVKDYTATLDHTKYTDAEAKLAIPLYPISNAFDNGCTQSITSANAYLGQGWLFPNADSDCKTQWNFQIPAGITVTTATVFMLYGLSGTSGVYSGLWDISSYKDTELPASNNVLSASAIHDFAHPTVEWELAEKTISLSTTNIGAEDKIEVRFTSDASNSVSLVINAIWLVLT